MFTHIVVGADDVDVSRSFYDAVLGALGIARSHMDGRGRALYSSPQGLFVVSRPINGEAACHANGGTIGFAAASPTEVDAWHAAGIAHGGSMCEDPPGWRESEFGDLYAAYLRDPAGNKICALHMGN